MKKLMIIVCSCVVGVSYAGQIALTSGNNLLHLVEEAGVDRLVNMNGSYNPGGFGYGLDVAWDKSSGELFSMYSTQLFRRSASTTRATGAIGGLTVSSSPGLMNIAVSGTGRIAVTGADNRVHLVDFDTSRLVNWGGLPTTSALGSAFDIAWDDSTGELVALLNNTIYRNDGVSGWRSRGSIGGLRFSTARMNLSVSANGQIAIADAYNRIHLLDEQRNLLVDWNGNPTYGGIGYGYDVAWDDETSELVTINGNQIYRTSGPGWIVGESLSGLYVNPDSMNLSVIPEPSVLALVGIFGGGVWGIRRFFLI